MSSLRTTLAMSPEFAVLLVSLLFFALVALLGSPQSAVPVVPESVLPTIIPSASELLQR